MITNESDGWKEVARLWEAAELLPEVSKRQYYIRLRGLILSGLCSTIEGMYYAGLIPKAVWVEMMQRMRKRLPPRLPNGYCWPQTKAGAQQRIQFALKMAEEAFWLPRHNTR